MTTVAQKQLLEKFPKLALIPQNKQVTVLHTQIRNKDTTREDFVFYSDRLMRLIMEEGLAHLPTEDIDVMTPTGVAYKGAAPCKGICGVSIMRAGESMEQALRETCRGARIGKILIQRNEDSSEKAPDARYNYAKCPKDIAERQVLLMDPMLATGGSAIKAMEMLINQFGCKEENIMFLNVVASPEGIETFCARFPNTRVITSAIDECMNEHKYIVPGLGDFGDRYFGTN
eukprot:GILI01005634.1.p2 GENE.GILI01005634.1~~GILI01005634.1.p2  ORF type:complete len:230 (-),score=78.28 GILI01005634.1:1215-1904(-)